MIRLVRVEVRRLFSRRFTLITLLVVLLGLAAFQLLVAQQLSPPSRAEVASAQRDFDSVHEQWVSSHVQDEQDCMSSGGSAAECAQPEPTLNQFLGRATFAQTVGRSVELAAYLVAFAAFLVAASFIGAEYSSGSIGNWLSFVPRRGAVFGSKLITVAVFGAVASAVGSAFVLGVGSAIAAGYGAPMDKLATLVATGGRGVLIGLALAVVGFCAGLLTRHTAAGIGLLLGYLFVWFVRNTFLAEQAWSQRFSPAAPESNIAAILHHGTTYAVPVKTITADGVNLDFVEHTISLSHGLIYWAVLLVVLTGGAWLVFRRRDVT